MKHEETIYCGIDVSKHYLDAHINNKVIRFDNTLAGVQSLMTKTKDVHYVFESTGGYERTAAWYLMSHERTVSIVNPGRVRDYAKSMGQLAKTDCIDAMMITAFSRTTQPRITTLPSSGQRELHAFVDRRVQLIEIRVAESNRLETTGESLSRKMINSHLKWLKKQIVALEKLIEKAITTNTSMAIKASRIQSIQGLGKTSAVTILAHLPEIGTLPRNQVAALAGLAPYNKDSGKFRGQRHVQGGRKKIRSCLYMAALTAIRCNERMKLFYSRLVNENNRPKKVAIIAVMRKLIIAANSAVKNPHFAIDS